MSKIYLWHDSAIRTNADRPSITASLLPGDTPKPAVLVIPGGGYCGVCENTEGTPIARRFNLLGFHAFVLDYRTTPNRWPAPQLDAMRAMKLIRGNAADWHVDPARISSCGFSAGAHLAGSLGTICDELDASDGDEFDAVSHRPDSMILCYGVLSFADWSDIGTMQNLLGDKIHELNDTCSLTLHVDENTPPAFLMHTMRDQIVPYRNSMEFADAMARAKRPCQLSLYCWGDHGMLLGADTTDVGCWPELTKVFLANIQEAEQHPVEFREKYTNAYQSCKECNRNAF